MYPAKPKILTIWSFSEKVDQPVVRVWMPESVYLNFKPSSATHRLCDLRKLLEHSDSSSVRWCFQ